MGFALSTHIANGYKEDIKGKVAVDRELYTRISREGGGKLSNGAVGVEIHGKTEHDVEHLIQLPGFVKIASGKFLAFGMSGEDGRVYVSISAEGKLIAENFPVRNGQNVIVDGDGDLVNAKPGKIWKDTEGRKHSIPKERSSGVNVVEDRGELSPSHGHMGRKQMVMMVEEGVEVKHNIKRRPDYYFRTAEQVVMQEDIEEGMFTVQVVEQVEEEEETLEHDIERKPRLASSCQVHVEEEEEEEEEEERGNGIYISSISQLVNTLETE